MSAQLGLFICITGSCLKAHYTYKWNSYQGVIQVYKEVLDNKYLLQNFIRNNIEFTAFDKSAFEIRWSDLPLTFL